MLSIFFRCVQAACDNQPLILVDRGLWSHWAFKRLGIKFQHETFGERTPIEKW